MPNRMLKETICTSCEVDSLTTEAERFFYRLMVQVDDFGRCDARLPILRARCFPLKVDIVKDEDIDKWLQELIDIGLVQLYSVGGKAYLFFINWDKHQQKRAKHSKYPAPDGNVISSDIKCDHVITDVTEKRETRNEKREYAPAVSLTEEQYEKLIERFGKSDTDDRIETLSLYKQSRGKKYKCDYSTVLAWARKDGVTPANNYL